MSRGVVPILSDVSGHNELVINSFNGYIFSDISELISVLHKVQLLDARTWKKLSINASKFIKKMNEIGYTNLTKVFAYYGTVA